MKRVVVLLVLLLCAVVGAAATDPFLPPTAVATDQDREGRYTVGVPVGNPATVQTLNLDLVGETSRLPRSVQLLSRTAALYADGVHGSEIFYLGHYKVRLHVEFTDVESPTLALGLLSDVWRWWPEYTLVPGRLLLGGYDDQARLRIASAAALQRVADALPGAPTILNGTALSFERQLSVHTALLSTALPADLYTAENFTFEFTPPASRCDAPVFAGTCAVDPLQFTSVPQHVVVDRDTEFPWLAVRRLDVSEPPPERLLLGSAGARLLWRWRRWFSDEAAVEPNYRALGASRFSTFLAVLCVVVLLPWIAIAVGWDEERVDARLAAFRSVQMGAPMVATKSEHATTSRRQAQAVVSYGVILMVFALLGVVWSMRVDLVLRFFLGTARGLWLTTWLSVTVLVCISVVITSVGLIRPGHPRVPPYTRGAFELGLFVSLWLAAMEFVETKGDLAFGLFALTFGAYVSTWFLFTLWTWYSAAPALLYGAGALVLYWLLGAVHVPIMVRIIWPGHSAPLALGALYVVLVVLVPTWFIFVSYAIRRSRK